MMKMDFPIELSNTENVPGKTISEFHGIVSGSTVRAKHVGRDFMAGLKTSWAVNSKATPNFSKKVATKPFRAW